MWKIVFNMFYRKLDFLNFKQRSSKITRAYKPASRLGYDLFLFGKKKSLFQSFISKSVK